MARHAKRGRGWRIAAASLGVLVFLSAGTAYAAYRYDRTEAARILPGVSIAGVDVGGMTRDQALRALRERAERTLTDDLVVTAAGHRWTLTPAALGMSADVEGAVQRAFDLADRMSLVSRLYHRIRDVPVRASFDLTFTVDRTRVEAFVQQASDEVALPVVNARFALVEDRLVMRRSQPGQELKVRLAAARIAAALERHAGEVELPVRTVEPTRPSSALGMTIVVDVSENRLWLYDGLEVVKEYPVATGMPAYPTPVGTFEIVDKKENPTWYNPDPDGWGAGLPRVIGPGPGNPLGTRALYLSAPGIRIHGTWDSASIGTAASHGCIRMYIEDAEELYPLVDVGTRVIVKP